MTVPNFLAAAVMASTSDLVAEIPERLARLLAPRFGLVVRYDLSDAHAGTLMQVWHRALGERPAHAWLREVVRQTARTFAEKTE